MAYNVKGLIFHLLQNGLYQFRTSTLLQYVRESKYNMYYTSIKRQRKPSQNTSNDHSPERPHAFLNDGHFAFLCFLICVTFIWRASAVRRNGRGVHSVVATASDFAGIKVSVVRHPFRRTDYKLLDAADVPR
ncbi:hypothetical protein Trydic_g1833 [Trypoxylus dichotomus]